MEKHIERVSVKLSIYEAYEIIRLHADSLYSHIRPCQMARESYCFHFTETETEVPGGKLTCFDKLTQQGQSRDQSAVCQSPWVIVTG